MARLDPIRGELVEGGEPAAALKPQIGTCEGNRLTIDQKGNALGRTWDPLAARMTRERLTQAVSAPIGSPSTLTARAFAARWASGTNLTYAITAIWGSIIQSGNLLANDYAAIIGGTYTWDGTHATDTITLSVDWPDGQTRTITTPWSLT